jgi:hypothetical protein
MENGFDPLFAGKGRIAATATTQGLAARSAFFLSKSLNAHLECVVDEISPFHQLSRERIREFRLNPLFPFLPLKLSSNPLLRASSTSSVPPVFLIIGSLSQQQLEFAFRFLGRHFASQRRTAKALQQQGALSPSAGPDAPAGRICERGQNTRGEERDEI